MKKTSRGLIIVGWVLVAFNMVGYFGKSEEPQPIQGDAYRIAYYIGFNMFLIMGIILLIIGYGIRRKAMRKNAKEDLLDNFLNDSSKNHGS
jgi:hypothetical protein